MRKGDFDQVARTAVSRLALPEQIRCLFGDITSQMLFRGVKHTGLRQFERRGDDSERHAWSPRALHDLYDIRPCARQGNCR